MPILPSTSSQPSGATSDTPQAAPDSPLTDQEWVFLEKLKVRTSALDAAEASADTSSPSVFASRFPRDRIAELARSAKATTGIFRKTERDAGFACVCEAADALATAPKDDIRAAAREVIRRARTYLDTVSIDAKGLLAGVAPSRALPSGRRRPMALDNAFHAKAMLSAASKALGTSIDEACGYPEAMRIDAPYRAKAISNHALAMSMEFTALQLPGGSTVRLICDASGQPRYARRAADDASLDRDLLGAALMRNIREQTDLPFGQGDVTLHGHPTAGLAVLSPAPTLAPAFRMALGFLSKGDTTALPLLREASSAALASASASALQRTALSRLLSLDLTSDWQHQIQQADGHFLPLDADRGFPSTKSLASSLDALRHGALPGQWHSDFPALLWVPSDASPGWDQPIDVAMAAAIAKLDTDDLRGTLLSSHAHWTAELSCHEIHGDTPTPHESTSKSAVLNVVASVELVQQLLIEAPGQTLRELLSRYAASIADHIDAQALNWADSVDPLDALLPEDALRVIDAEGRARPTDSLAWFDDIVARGPLAPTPDGSDGHRPDPDSNRDARTT